MGISFSNWFWGVRRAPGGRSFLFFCFLCLAGGAGAVPCRMVQTAPGAWMAADDAGAWAGGSRGVTHQVSPGYEAKKELDLSGLPEAVWRRVHEVRLSLFFCVRDYSWHDLAKKNGLDESFEIVVNGRVHRFRTGAGFPVYREGHPLRDAMRWHDLRLPREELRRGPNVFIFRKAPAPPGKKHCDDYFYLGIDDSVPARNSWVRFSATAPWRRDELTVPGTTGEYMVRLYLLAADRRFTGTWTPARSGRGQSAVRWFLYAGGDGPDTRIEWDPLILDPLAPVEAVLEFAKPPVPGLFWLDSSGKKIPAAPPAGTAGSRTVVLRLGVERAFQPSGLVAAGHPDLVRVTLRGARGYHPQPHRIDMAPSIRPPRGGPVSSRRPGCRIEGTGIHRVASLENSVLRAVFRVGSHGHLRLVSFFNEWARAEMVGGAADSALFLVEVGKKRLAGSRDFGVQQVQKLSDRPGVRFVMRGESVPLEADLRVWVDAAGLRMALTLRNRGTAPLAFKTAFPHLSGLRISADPAEDYYFFPWGGGVIADVATVIRRGYGDNEAYYQVMDLFSPGRGAGLLVRCLDDDGRYKVLALRKFVPGLAAINGDACHCPTTAEYKWTNSLPRLPGTGFAFEYLRRTRAPGAAFSPKPAAFEPHRGDWHVAMRRYADWAHRVWHFRPYPSKLRRVVNMLAAGWGTGYLFKHGHYRTDFMKPMTDCIELMSWWDWSPLGPFSTPMDRLHEVMTDAQIRRWKGYFVKDPVTGKTMWNNQPGDYRSYNPRFGGLPAFRKAIQTYRKMGALVTLYTDPFRLDDNCETGRKYGRKWDVVLPDGSFSKAYLVWNPCHDCPEVREWVARTMERVMRQTGADGIRLDEYGHRGWACFSKLHKHTFAEWGCTEWQRAVAETVKMVHARMDKVRPGLVLTTEHPGYDFLMQYLEGCITYDLTVEATPLRPVECNLQRFYFPECKAYELDHRHADPRHLKRFWNAVGSFGSYYPEAMYHALRENDDAFGARGATPLIPPVTRFLYVNRFVAPGGEKTIYTVYNATGHTFFGPALRVTERGAGRRVSDLLTGREIPVGRDHTVRVFLERNGVRALALLPRVIRSAALDGRGRLVLVLGSPAAGARLALCNRAGRVLRAVPAHSGENRLEFSGLDQAGAPAGVWVKLLRAGVLVDQCRIQAGKAL